MTTTVPPTGWDSTYAAVAAALRDIADCLDTLTDPSEDPLIRIDIQPRVDTDEQKVAAIDEVAQVLLGKPGETYPCGGGHHHGAHGAWGPVNISIFNKVGDPETRELHAELARLRAIVGEDAQQRYAEAREQGRDHVESAARALIPGIPA